MTISRRMAYLEELFAGASERAQIDDTSTAGDRVWSAFKVGQELSAYTKVNTSVSFSALTVNGRDVLSEIDGLTTSVQGKVSSSLLGQANGVATLDGTGKVPASQLPAFVDDVQEYANLGAFPATGQSGTIYVALDTGFTYRWGASAYVEISASPGSTDAVPEGATNLYHTSARVRAVTLTGFTNTVGAVADTDTIVVAFGKLNKQVTDNTTSIAANTAAISGKISSSLIGAANGVASLGSDGKVPASQLPAMGGGGLTDADYGDVLVGGGGTTMTVQTVNGQTPATLSANNLFTGGSNRFRDGLTIGRGVGEGVSDTAITFVNTNFYTQINFQSGNGTDASVSQYGQLVTSPALGLYFDFDNGTTFRSRTGTTRLTINGGGATFSVPVYLVDDAYGAGWNGSVEAPTKNAVYDKIESVVASVAANTTAIGNKVDSSLLGVANGIATLDSSGLIPSSQLPSFVDDVLEYANLASFPATGVSGKIYIAADTSYSYRWTGSVYAQIIANSGTIAWGNVTGTLANQTDLQTALNGKLALTGGTLTGKLNTVASAAGGAGLNLPHGAAPTAPVNGDVWTTTAGVFARLNGTSYQLANAASLGNYLPLAGGTLTGDLIGLMFDAQTPNNGTTGGLRLRGNATSGFAYHQITNSTAGAQWGYWKYSSGGDADWNGTAGLKVNGNLVYHAANKPTKSDVGLANVDNTSDQAKRPTVGTLSASRAAADTDNNTHMVASGASQALTLNSTPATGTSFTVRFTTAWTITCTSLSKNGAAPVANGSIAANSLITFFHEGAGTWIASGNGLT